MATNTTNYNLVKPDTTDKVNISQINGNMDILDTQLKAVDNAKQPLLTFDDYPTYQSTNPVTSWGVYTALGEKQPLLNYDQEPTANSQKIVNSGNIYKALANQSTLSAQSGQTYTFSAGYFPAIKTAGTTAYACVPMPKFANSSGWTITALSTSDIVVIDTAGNEIAVATATLDYMTGFAGNLRVTTQATLPDTPIGIRFKSSVAFINYGKG